MQNAKCKIGREPYVRLLSQSVIYRSLLQREKVPRNEADEVLVT